MGSTLVMALIADQQAHIANVGDSRAYRISQAGIEQISVDHSLVERLVQIGQLTREEARTHKQKNVIYSTIGDKPDMDVSFYHVPLQPGDRLLLCSDGLCGMITDDEILAISRSQSDPAAACRSLIEAAKRAGGHDNITAIIVQMGG
ncbi:MAG: serine/threonine-protein phosphatase [Anaerolineales bacterium]|nr:serine/threonine-protein phosphatase [Anaerolineales bacterium]